MRYIILEFAKKNLFTFFVYLVYFLIRLCSREVISPMNFSLSIQGGVQTDYSSRLFCLGSKKCIYYCETELITFFLEDHRAYF